MQELIKMRRDRVLAKLEFGMYGAEGYNVKKAGGRQKMRESETADVFFKINFDPL